MTFRPVLLLFGLTATACLGPGEAVPIRYFSAEIMSETAIVGANETLGAALRVRRVGAASHLKERMVWRVSDVEYGFYELDRWTELPVAWFERALTEQLFQAGGFTRSEASSAPTLDAELIAFEESLGADHEARVAAVFAVTERGGHALLDVRIERSAPVEGSNPADVARAMRSALEEVVREAARVIGEAAAGKSAG